MNIPRRPQHRRRGVPGAGLGVGALALLALCCAGPGLLAGGVLTAVGSWLINPWMIAAGTAIAIAATALAIRRRAQAPANMAKLTGRIDRCGDTYVGGA